MTQGREMGLTTQYIVPELSMNEVAMAGGAAEGAITFTGWNSMSDNPMNQAFITRYRTEYGIEPDPRAAQSYATPLNP